MVPISRQICSSPAGGPSRRRQLLSGRGDDNLESRSNPSRLSAHYSLEDSRTERADSRKSNHSSSSTAGSAMHTYLHPGGNYLEEKLHRLARDGDLRELKSYLEHGITGRVNHADSDGGDSPLHHAARAMKNSAEMARLVYFFCFLLPTCFCTCPSV